MLHMDFLQLLWVGSTLRCGGWAPHCSGFSCFRAQALEHTGLAAWLWDPMDCSPPGSTVHGIWSANSKARTLEWVAIPSSRGSPWLRNWTRISLTAGGFFTFWGTREAQNAEKLSLKLFAPSFTWLSTPSSAQDSMIPPQFPAHNLG